MTDGKSERASARSKTANSNALATKIAQAQMKSAVDTEVTPICGSPGPNITEQPHYMVNSTELASSLQPSSYSPSSTHFQLPPGTPSLAGHRSSQGGTEGTDNYIKNYPEIPVSIIPDNEHRGRTLIGKQSVNDERIERSPPQFYNTYSYSRDTTSPRPSVKSNSLFLERPRTRSPDEYRRSTSSSTRQWLSRVPEEMEPPTSGNADQQHQHQVASANVHERRYYGSVTISSRHQRDDSSDRQHSESSGDDASSISSQEEEWILDEELAKEGLYRGNYKNLVTLYTLVPFSTLLAFVFLALLRTFAYPHHSPSPYPYPPYLPFPLPEMIVATALWSLSYLLRDFLYATSLCGTNLVPFPIQRFPSFIPALTATLSALLQSASTLFFRQLAIPILLVPQYSSDHLGLFSPASTMQSVNTRERHFPSWQDDAFRRVWWVALGWAAAEAIVGIKQGYESIALYKDVLVDVKGSSLEGKRRITYIDSPVGQDGDRDVSQHNTRTVTPPRSSNPMVEVDTSSTPTQRDWESRLATHENIYGGRRPAPLALSPGSNRRPHQDSFSSLESLGHSSHLDPSLIMQGSGERQPLLKLAKVTESSAVDELQSSRMLIENEVERDLDQLMALKSREELEEVYGMPVIRIPVFISCLHRINSILSSLGITLLLTAAYMRSTLAYHYPPLFSPHSPLSPLSWPLSLISLPEPILHPLNILAQPFAPSNRSLLYTIPPLLLLQTLLAMMHTPWILPRIGIHTFVYVGLLVSLGLFFGGLGIWEALS